MSKIALQHLPSQKILAESRSGLQDQFHLPGLRHPLLRLQQTIGNQAVGRLLQAKLTVSQPGDAYEREADRIAEQVMRMPDSAMRAQRQGACCEETKPECEKCQLRRLLLQRKATNSAELPTAPPIVHDVLRSSGQPLDPAPRALMEARFRHDFSRVRVHADAKAAESAQAVNALAYTVGDDVVFGAGQYAPETSEGRKLMAHELAHVVQQAGDPTEARVARGQYHISKLKETDELESEKTAILFDESPGSERKGSMYPFPQPRWRLPKAKLSRAFVLKRHITDDATSREAKKRISAARWWLILHFSDIEPNEWLKLYSRIEEADKALESYRATIDASSTGLTPVLATTTTNPDVSALVLVGLGALAAWILGSSITTRSEPNRQASERLALALKLIAETNWRVSLRRAPTTEAPQTEVQGTPRAIDPIPPIKVEPRPEPAERRWRNRRRKQECFLQKGDPLGGNEEHNALAKFVTNEPVEYILSAEGYSARYDGMDTIDTLYEIKTRHDFLHLLDQPERRLGPRGRLAISEGVPDIKDQLENQAMCAAMCGYEFRIATNNRKILKILRQLAPPGVPVDYVQFHWP